jgi:hypothetical protein
LTNISKYCQEKTKKTHKLIFFGNNIRLESGILGNFITMINLVRKIMILMRKKLRRYRFSLRNSGFMKSIRQKALTTRIKEWN